MMKPKDGIEGCVVNLRRQLVTETLDNRVLNAYDGHMASVTDQTMDLVMKRL